MSLTRDTFDHYTDSAADAEWLGQLVTYTVSENVLDYDEMVRLLTNEGLAAYAPKKPHNADVFRRVCSSSERRKIETDDENVLVNVLIRDVGTADGKVLKKIVAEEVDAAGKRLRFHEVHDVEFDQASERVTSRPLAVGFPAADDVAFEILSRYPKEKGSVDGAAIRTLIRRVLVGHDAISVRESGGLYFVMQSRNDVVKALHRFSQQVPGCRLYRIPLIDNGEQRAMIQEAAETNAMADIDQVMTDIAKLLKQDTVRPQSATTMVGKFQAIKERAEKYTDLLNANLGGVEARLLVLNQQVAQLMQKATSAATSAAA